MSRFVLSIAAVGFASAGCSAASVATFGDADFATKLARGASGAGVTVFSPVDSAAFRGQPNQPVVMFSQGPSTASLIPRFAPASPRPLFPHGAIEPSGKASGGGETKELPRVVVVPLPAPAGMAIAGLVLLGSIRRR